MNEENKSILLFGRSYTPVGSSETDILLKTKGLVKILWGNKFVDIIKDGELAVESKSIFTGSPKTSKDGIYVDGLTAVLVSNGTQIPLTSGAGNTYLSLAEQNLTPDLKHQALVNVGFIHSGKETTLNIKSGIVYIEDEQKLYTIKDGVISEYTVPASSTFESAVIINQKLNNGALIIKGSGTKNGIYLNSAVIFNEDDKINLLAKGLRLDYNGIRYIDLNNNSNTFTKNVIAPEFSNKEKSFRLFVENNTSILEVDEVRTKNSKDESYSNSFSTKESNKISSILLGQKIIISLEKPSKFNNDDILLVETESYSIPFKVVQSHESDLEVTLLTDDVLPTEMVANLNDLSVLVGQTIFSISSPFLSISSDKLTYNNSKTIAEYRSNSSNLIFGKVDDTTVGVKAPYLESAVAKYSDTTQIPTDSNSLDFASTAWTNVKLREAIPRGTIIMFNGTEIPNGWALCDGQNGTPNLVDKFIVGGSAIAESSSNILVGDTQSVATNNLKDITSKSITLYSLIFLIKL